MDRKSEPRNKSEPKKVWDHHPTLTIFGSVESLTQVCNNKDVG